MGILLGWIIQKRWLTLAALALNLVAVFTLPRLPTPFSYLVVFPPALLIVAVFYEVSGLGSLLKISPRVRLSWAVWMGFCGLVLMSGIVVSGTNAVVLVATIGVFAVLAMSGSLWVAVINARHIRQEAARRRAAK